MMRNAIIFSLAILLLINSATALELKEGGSAHSIPFMLAFLAGILSVLSPCSVPLLLGYLAIISKEKSGFLPKTFAFFLGLSVMWVLLGFSAAGLGGIVSENIRPLHQIAGFMIVLFGFMYLFEVPIPAINFSKKVETTVVGMFVFGILFTLAWIPCIGPILGGILLIATTGSIIEGALLLFLYAIGFMVSLITIFFILEKSRNKVHFKREITTFNRKFSIYNLIAGLFLIAIGLFYLFDQIATLLGILQPLADLSFALELIIANNQFAAGLMALLAVLYGLYHLSNGRD